MGDRVVRWVGETTAKTEWVVVIEVVVPAVVGNTVGGIRFVVIVESSTETERIMMVGVVRAGAVTGLGWEAIEEVGDVAIG